MGNELVVRQETNAALSPHSYDDVTRLAVSVVKSGLYGVRSADDAFVRIITGIELGISPMQALRTIAVVQGKPVLDAALIAALCMRHHECKSWRLVESSDQRCTIETEHARNGKTRLTYTLEQAKLAGLTGKDNWRHYPAAMLRARCTSALARIAYPDVVAGVYTPDEMQAPASTGVAETIIDAVPAAVPVAKASAPTFAPEPTAADEIIARIGVCDDVAALNAIGQSVREAALSTAEKGRVREHYQRRQRELKAAAKARASEPKQEAPLPKVGNGVDDFGPDPDEHDPQTGEVHTREPGEEG